MASHWSSLTMTCVPYGREFAPMRRRLAGPISPQDAWVAAAALALDAPLATNNRRDYEHVKKLRLLPI